MLQKHFTMIDNPSEHKSDKKSSLIPGVRFMAAIITLTMMVTAPSCSNNTRPNPGSRTPEETLADYSSFLNSLSSMKDVSTSELISCVKEWKAVDDSVTGSINKVSSFNDNDSLSSQYLTAKESTMAVILSLVDTKNRNFSDYLQCARELNYTRLDSATLESVNAFRNYFSKLDQLPVYNSTNKETIQYYEYLLNKTLKSGIETSQDLFNFIREEDRAFRTFLCHLPTLGEIPLTAVRDSTKRVLSNIISLSGDDSFSLSSKEILIILTMRNNRRLIQNASQCIIDIEKKKVSACDQTTAYLWMLLQPWVSFDSFAFSLMDQHQWDEMEMLADKTPEILKRLKGAEFPVEPSLLPNILIKSLITQLI